MDTLHAGNANYALVNPNPFETGRIPLNSVKVVMLAGAVYDRGTFIGQITANSKFKKSTTAASDGSQIVANGLILLHEVDATGGDVEGMAAERGEFVEQAIPLTGTGHTIASIKSALAAKGIYFVKGVVS